MRGIVITGASCCIGLAAHNVVDKQVDTLRTVRPISAVFDSPKWVTPLSRP
jgi:hypothetical protein